MLRSDVTSDTHGGLAGTAVSTTPTPTSVAVHMTHGTALPNGRGGDAEYTSAEGEKLVGGRLSSPSAASTSLKPLVSDSTLPLAQSLGLAVAYMSTSMCYFLCIRHSKSTLVDGYDGAMLVMAIEITKITVSVLLKYLEDGEFLPYTIFCGRSRRAIWRNGLPYAVPSLLYAVYNNLTFVNLNLYDPGTYQVFMQTRILFTGVLFTAFLGQALSVRKWVALVLLAVGVAAKYFSPRVIELDGRVVFMLFQALLSSLAGVYNEYVLKKDANLSIHQQNFFMYFFALFFNPLIGLIANPSYYLQLNVSSLLHPIFIPIILFGAATGLSAAFMLKFINVIVKAFASAVEVLLTAVVAAALLGEQLTGQDVLAASIVMVSVYVYYTRGCGDATMVTCGMKKS